MTRKDFWLIAKAIREVRVARARSGPTLEHLALVMGRKLKDANPEFQLTRFLIACRVSPDHPRSTRAQAK